MKKAVSAVSSYKLMANKLQLVLINMVIRSVFEH